MIHAYNEQFLDTIKTKLALMFELAFYSEGMDVDAFASAFINSNISIAFEKADPVFILGKSANELLALMLDKEPVEFELSEAASPEYWVGWVLAYTQWYLNKPYKELIAVLPCSELLNNYFPFHEMDISKSVELFQSRLPQECKLKQLRKEKGYSQTDLALLSNVPERTIRSYEQGTTDISKASAETLYALARELGCTIEELIGV